MPKRGSLPLLLLVLTLFVPLATQAMPQPTGKPLLRTTSRKGSVPVNSDAKVIRRRNVLVELAPLRAKASRITLPLFDDSVVVLVRDETEAATGEVIVWEGEVEGQPGSMAILATVKSIVVGDVMTRSREGAFGFYQIRYLGNRVHTLMEVDQSKFPPEDEVEGRPSSRATARDVLAGNTMRRDPEGSSGFYRARYPGKTSPFSRLGRRLRRNRPRESRRLSFRLARIQPVESTLSLSIRTPPATLWGGKTR